MPGIYVHIPFCAQKCNYCDFHSIPHETNSFVGSYLRALKDEAAMYGENVQDVLFDSLYIGGGTPTILSAPDLADLLSTVFGSFSFLSCPEVTVEANPKTLTEKKVEALLRSGVNRISLGAQAFQDHLLQRLGRIHDVKDTLVTVDLLRRVGVSNFNLDLIYGLPNQTVEDWAMTLNKAISCQPTHLSCYSLIVEEGTPFAKEKELGLLALPDEGAELAMGELTDQHLGSAGYARYEISNYSLPSYQSRHNLIYWHNQEYIGLGSGAHGYWQGERYANELDIKHYIDSIAKGLLPVWERNSISLEQEMDETMMLGLRLLNGVREADFSSRFGMSYWDIYHKEISGLIKKGLLEFSGGTLRLTAQGLLLGNSVFAEFVRLPLDK